MTRNGAFFLGGVVLAMLVMVAVIFTPSSMPVAGASANSALAQAAPQPIPSGPVVTTPAFAQALLHWKPPDASSVGNSHAGQRETWFNECHSMKVNTTVTLGWCFSHELKLFYNIQTQRLLDPLTGRVFALGPTPGTLVELVAEEDDELGRPPTLTLPKGSTPGPLDLQCTPSQAAVVQQGAAGLTTNANRTDSPAMASLFSFEADWWSNYCA